MSRLQQSREPGARSAGPDQAGSPPGTLAVDQGEMLRPEPPPQIIRCTAWLLIGIFLALFLASVLVHIPETVRCSFVLVPQNAADPIQSPLLALVQAVKVTEGQDVPAGAGLFLVGSDEIRALQSPLGNSGEDFRKCQNRTAKLEEDYTG